MKPVGTASPRTWLLAAIGCVAALSIGCGSRACSAAPAAAGTARANPGSASRGPGLGARPEPFSFPVARSFDLSHVQPAHFAAALGKDPERIFVFVRDQIAFEPYTGALRGPRGTLLAMAGNAVDRAALLASLLEESGFRVRFVRGILPDALADQLVLSIWDERPGLASGPAAGENELQGAAMTLLENVKRDCALITQSLQRSNLPLRADSFVTSEALRRETREHYWVEWWTDNAWSAMDPSFASATTGQTFADADAHLEALPASVFHRVDIRVRVEERVARDAALREVLHYSARAMDLSGVDLILGHQSEAGDAGQLTPFLIIGQERVPGSTFSLKTPPDSVAGGMLDAFGGGPEERPLATAEMVELEFVSPDGRRDVVVREIFDRVRRSVRARREAVSAEELPTAGAEEATAGVYDFLFTTGATDRWHLANPAPEPDERDQPMDVGAGLRRISTAFAVLSDQLTGRVAVKDGPAFRSFLETPRVQVTEWVPREDRLRISLDLRRNRARVVTSTYSPEFSFRAHVMRGVADGHLERLVVEYLTQPRGEQQAAVLGRVSTSSLFERARAGGAPFILLAGSAAELAPQIPADARARLGDAIGAHRVIVAPRQAIEVAGEPRMAWWQITADSGETIGVTDEGLHQAVEAIIVRMDGRNPSYHVAFRVNGRFISTRGRQFRFSSRAQAENFVQHLGNRLTGMGYEFAWFAI